MLVDEQAIETALAEPGVWPNLSQAAEIIGLTKSALSKQAHAGRIEYEILGLGRGRHVLPPQEVLRIGGAYHRVSEATVVDRLTAFLAQRLPTEAGLIRRALLRMLNGVEGDIVDGSRKEVGMARATGPEQKTGQPEAGDVPGWLLEVEKLRANPDSLVGSISFVSPNDTIGRISLGPPIDGVADLSSPHGR